MAQSDFNRAFRFSSGVAALLGRAQLNRKGAKSTKAAQNISVQPLWPFARFGSGWGAASPPECLDTDL